MTKKRTKEQWHDDFCNLMLAAEDSLSGQEFCQLEEMVLKEVENAIRSRSRDGR